MELKNEHSCVLDMACHYHPPLQNGHMQQICCFKQFCVFFFAKSSPQTISAFHDSLQLAREPQFPAVWEVPPGRHPSMPRYSIPWQHPLEGLSSRVGVRFGGFPVGQAVSVEKTPWMPREFLFHMSNGTSNGWPTQPTEHLGDS